MYLEGSDWQSQNKYIKDHPRRLQRKENLLRVDMKDKEIEIIIFLKAIFLLIFSY